jgi:DNA-binding transcriptional ArsR family regulator
VNQDGDGLKRTAFDWNPFAPRLVHPTKVAIIEALLYMNQPLSATELRELFGERHVSTVSYHLGSLVSVKAIVAVDECRVRGATKTSYFVQPLTPPLMPYMDQ